MQCPCGGETIPYVHTVKTLRCAKSWGADFAPARIQREVCAACGRQLVIDIRKSEEEQGDA